MSASGTQALVTGAMTDFGTAALVILGASVAIIVGLIVFRFGMRKLKGATRG